MSDHTLPPAFRQTGEHGQSLVEFAVMGIVLLMLLQGVLDLGRAYFTFLALKDAAADGAYFAAAYPRCVDGPSGSVPPPAIERDGNYPADNSLTACGNPNNIEYRTRKSAPAGGLVDWTNATVNVTYTLPLNYNPGSLVTVTVIYEYELMTPLVSAIVAGKPLPLYAESVGVIVNNGLP